MSETTTKDKPATKPAVTPETYVPHPLPAARNDVDEAIVTRHSIRAFLPDPVPLELVRHILEVAQRAPSGTNTQPWRVHVLASAEKEALCAEILAAHNAHEPESAPEYTYYPPQIPEPYLGRRRTVGWGLYGLLGIAKGEREKTHRQHGRNYLFFDAPVGMIFVLENIMQAGAFIDIGMYMQNIMIAARGHGLDTCPQAAFTNYNAIIHRHLGIPDSDMIICGMALGKRDPAAVENRLIAERVPLDDVATFHGF